MKRLLREVIVDYVECYLDGYAREVYAIDVYFRGISATISGIILDDEIELTDDLFDDIEVKTAVYEQFKAGELEVVIHNKCL